MIKAVIFDFGGVVHTLGDKKLSQIIAERTGRDREEIKARLIPLLLAMSTGNLNEDKFWEEMGGKIEGVWEEQMVGNKLNQEVVDLVTELKEGGIITAVLSNTIPPHTKLLRSTGWYDRFDKVFLSWEIGLRKPNRQAFEFALTQLQVEGDECIYIDDLESNLIPARELGMKTVLARDSQQIVKDVKTILENNK